MTIEKKVGQDDDTRIYIKKTCASGIIDPLLNKPLWPSHYYMGDDNRLNLYCPMHQEIYERIKRKEEQEKAQRKLDGLDGTR